MPGPPFGLQFRESLQTPAAVLVHVTMPAEPGKAAESRSAKKMWGTEILIGIMEA